MTDTVLIVDDSLTVRMDLQEAFEDAGFRTLVCATAAAAREALADAGADVVVLDVLLPDGDGVELLMELRASADSRAAVVLMLSTEAEVKDRVRGLRTGADEYVGKPYDTHYVIARARELLRARRAETVAGRSTVLIVDDSVTFREALRHALEEAGYAVLVAGSGEEGLRAAAAERPDAVVVDSVLPGLDGATVIRRLRLDAALRSVPCLLLTGSEDRDAELRAFEAGADAFVRKEEDVEVILARLAAALRSAATRVPDKTASLLGPKRILAVDDSATYLAEVAAMLRDEGYDVVPARSGEEALELLAVQAMDCILLDLLMPGLGGRETCRRIKAAPVVRDIPLIMLTAHEDRGAMLDALEAGADDYIQKSSEFEVLKARVRAQLRRKQFEDDNRRIRAELHNMALEAAEARAARTLATGLRRSRDELELRVQERTAELTRTTHRLESEIAERSRVESMLRERDAALHRAHVMTKLAHVITRPDGSFETWSDTLPPLIGVEPARMPQSTREWMSLLHPEDRQTFRSTSIAAGVDGTRKDVEYRLRRADGAWIHLRQVIEPIPGQVYADGRMRWFSTIQDVTEQERAGEELRESQRLLKAIIDNSAAIIYVKDLQGRYLLVNRRYSELFSIGSEAIVGKSDHELFAKEAADAFHAMDERVMAADAPLIEEEVAPHDDGPHTYVSVKCPLRDRHGRVIGVFGISTDITDRKRAEDALRASEERTRMIVDTALDAVVTMDSSGSITGWSPQAETTFGWTRTEALGRSLAQTIIPPHHREDHRRGLEHYLATGEGAVLNKRVELTALHRDGREFPIDLSITPIRTSDSIGFSAFLRDVTDRKRIEEVRMRLAAIVESSDDSIVSKNLEGVITSWNPAAQRLFGYSAAEAIGRGVQMLVPPERSGEEPDILARIARGENVDHFETVRVRKDGSRVDVSATISPIRDAEGRIVGASKIARDIADRKLAQARLQVQLDRLNLLDQITRAIGERQDLQSIYQVAIRSLEERLPVDFSCVFRYDAADNALTVIRVGAHSQALAMELAMDEQSRIEIDQNGLSRCVRGELVYEADIQEIAYPFPQRLARGGLRSLVVAPLQSESRVFGILVVARQSPHSFSSADCEFLRQLSAHVALAAKQAELHGALQQAYDELRQTQQTVMQQERLRALGQMASGIAHDINNAISPVALYTESLLEREPHLSERGRGYLVTIARAIDDVAATVTRMREFYRQREPQLLLTPVQLNLLVQQVVDLTRARWSDMPQQQGTVIRLEIDLAPDLPAMLGVESEVREALINLVFNAVDAMPDGGALTLRTRCTAIHDGVTEAPARCAVVEVSDTGMGMDEDTRRRCMEPFFSTKGERGTGLGLATVYGAMQRHGADVDIVSAVGRGTTVRLTFPIPAIEPGGSAAPSPPQAPTSRLRILIVDDDPLLLKSLCDTLELDGHVVVTANGGQSGIEAFQVARRPAEAFDVVITDLGMPYVDGRKVAAAVKASAGATPVILLTGWGQRLVADGEIPAYVDRVLSKPPKLRELRAALAQLTLQTLGAGAADSTKEVS